MAEHSVSSRTGSLLQTLRDRVAGLTRTLYAGTDMAVAECAPDQLLELCKRLRDDDALAFVQLSDLCGVDYSAYGQTDWRTQETTRTGFSRGRGAGDAAAMADAPSAAATDRPRYAVVYHLLSLQHNRRLRLRCHPQDEPPRIESVSQLWNSAIWYEREAFDLFGILFEGNPDLRRLLTDYGFMGHPFRKDFPLEGRQEVRYDPEQGRVIYQPVTIRNRVLVPRVIRNDNRHLESGEKEGPGHA